MNKLKELEETKESLMQKLKEFDQLYKSNSEEVRKDQIKCEDINDEECVDSGSENKLNGN